MNSKKNYFFKDSLTKIRSISVPPPASAKTAYININGLMGPSEQPTPTGLCLISLILPTTISTVARMTSTSSGKSVRGLASFKRFHLNKTPPGNNNKQLQT